MTELETKDFQQFKVDGESVSESKFWDLLEEAISNSAGDSFDEMLDEQDDIEVCGIYYSRSLVFRKVDEIAYNCAFSDYISNLLEDARYDLEREHSVRYDMTDFEIIDATLPTELSIDLEDLVDDPDNYDNGSLEDVITEFISNEFGFCFNNYDYTLDENTGTVLVSKIDWDLE